MNPSLRQHNILASTSSLKYLEENESNIDFWFASKNNNLSKELMMRHEDDLDWSEVSKWCGLDILIDFEDKIKWKSTLENDNLSEELFLKYKNIIVNEILFDPCIVNK